MSVRRIDLGSYTLSIGVMDIHRKPKVRNEYVENTLLNIYDRRHGNPVVEDLMDKVVSRRSIPLDDGIATLSSIKEKAPYLTEYVDGCIEVLNGYKHMI